MWGGRSVSRPREEKQPPRSARNEIVVEWAGAHNPRAITPPLLSSSLLRPRHRDVLEEIAARLLTCCLFLLS